MNAIADAYCAAGRKHEWLCKFRINCHNFRNGESFFFLPFRNLMTILHNGLHTDDNRWKTTTTPPLLATNVTCGSLEWQLHNSVHAKQRVTEC